MKERERVEERGCGTVSREEKRVGKLGCERDDAFGVLMVRMLFPH